MKTRQSAALERKKFFADPVMVTTIFSLIIGVPCAYVVARYKMRKASMIVLLVRMIPGISFLLPWFSIFSAIGYLFVVIFLKSGSIVPCIIAHCVINGKDFSFPFSCVLPTKDIDPGIEPEPLRLLSLLNRNRSR